MEEAVAGKPGRSGRKRAGDEPKVYFNGRIDPDLRRQLETEARRNGNTLSREIEFRLKNSLKSVTFAGSADNAARTVGFLAQEAARLTTMGDKNWLNDHYAYSAFAEAFAKITKILQQHYNVFSRNEDEPEFPKFSHPIFDDHSALASSGAFQIITALDEASEEEIAKIPPSDPRHEYVKAAKVLDLWAKGHLRTFFKADDRGERHEQGGK